MAWRAWSAPETSGSSSLFRPGIPSLLARQSQQQRHRQDLIVSTPHASLLTLVQKPYFNRQWYTPHHPSPEHLAAANNPQARQTCRPRHARGLHRRLPLLLGLDALDGTYSPFSSQTECPANDVSCQPFVDSDHPLQNFFPPRVWAIRIPVILVLLGSAVVGSFLSVVMIRSNRKKAAKAKAAAKKK